MPHCLNSLWWNSAPWCPASYLDRKVQKNTFFQIFWNELFSLLKTAVNNMQSWEPVKSTITRESQVKFCFLIVTVFGHQPFHIGVFPSCFHIESLSHPHLNIPTSGCRVLRGKEGKLQTFVSFFSQLWFPQSLSQSYGTGRYQSRALGAGR